LTVGDRRLRLACWAGATRLLVLATALAMHALAWPRAPYGRGVQRDLFGALASWDGAWYRAVAVHGYLLVPGRQSDPAFFPVYPILLRGLHATGLSFITGGIILSNGAFVVAVVGLYELGRAMLPEDLAWRGALVAATFPVGYVYSMVYPESVVLAAIVFALLLAVRERWLASATVGMVAALGRPGSILFVLPLAAIVAGRWRLLSARQRPQALTAVAAPVAALATFPLSLAWNLGDVNAWSDAERAWGRSFAPAGVVGAFSHLPTLIGGNRWQIRDVVFAIVYLGLLAAARRAGLGAGWIAAGALAVLLPLASGSFVSDARFGLLAIPVYWGLAALTRRPRAFAALLTVSGVLLVAATLSIPFVAP
jgi:hypothetical protein